MYGSPTIAGDGRGLGLKPTPAVRLQSGYKRVEASTPGMTGSTSCDVDDWTGLW